MSADLATAFLLAAWATATPLLLAALGELVSERAGVLNIGLEGLMLVGAFAAFAVTVATGSPLLGALAAVAVGGLAALPFGWLVVRLGVDAVVAGTAWNLLCLGATAVGLDLLQGDSGSARLVEPLPRFLLPTLALLLVPAVALFLGRTRPGLVVRACGEDPAAARAVGVDVSRARIAAVLFGGAMAAAVGAHLALFESRTFVEEMTAGRGFVALAVVVCGRWSPAGVLVAALSFGAITALQFQFQARGATVPYHVFLALPYLATLVVLAGMAGRARAPAALGK
ncbi:MAG: ABC transporter permease [Planctomycetota bacterium JB042]